MKGSWQFAKRLGHLTLALLLVAGCSRSPDPEANAGNEPGPDAVDEGPDETAVALEERLAALKKNPPPKDRPTLVPDVTTPAPVARQPGPEEQKCFQCDATGQVGCGALGCDHGRRDCPGLCVTRKEGTWVRDPKPGSPPGAMAFVLRFPGVKSSWTVSEGHAGEIFQLRNGQLVSTGVCPTCRGSRLVRCKVCQGTGVRLCQVCEGQTAIPAAWKPTDNPWFNRQPDVVRLKDGRVFLGRDAGGDDTVVIFRTHQGETLTVPRADVIQWPKAE